MAHFFTLFFSEKKTNKKKHSNYAYSTIKTVTLRHRQFRAARV